MVSCVVLVCPLLSRCCPDSPTPRGSVECLQIQWRLESQHPGASAGRTSNSSRSTYRDVGVLAVLRSHCVWLRGFTGTKWEGKNAERAMLCRYATDIVQRRRGVATGEEEKKVMRAKRGRQETDDPLLTPWELGELGAGSVVAGACAGCRVMQSVERSGATWLLQRQGTGDMQ